MPTPQDELAAIVAKIKAEPARTRGGKELPEKARLIVEGLIKTYAPGDKIKASWTSSRLQKCGVLEKVYKSEALKTAGEYDPYAYLVPIRRIMQASPLLKPGVNKDGGPSEYEFVRI